MKVPGNRLALSFVAAACAAGLIAMAAAQSPAPRMERPQLPMRIADMQSRLHERAQSIDANHDGFVAAEEFQAFRAARRANRVQRRMARIDTNKDGRVSTVEFEAAHLARLERADANRDGQITREEIRAMRQQRRGERMQRRAGALSDPKA